MSTTTRTQLVDVITERVMRRLGESAAPCECAPVQAGPAELRELIETGACRLGCALKAATLPSDVAQTIDHTMLKPEATEEEIRTLCEEARQHHFASVCVNPCWVSLCSSLLGKSGVEVCTVIGFPLGASTSQSKAFETRQAVAQGATEVDMVLNVGALKGRDLHYVHDDIVAVVEAAGDHACVKVILETSKLDDDEKVAACALAKDAGAHYVKTSTGFGGGGATVEDVALMRRVVGGEMGVKASGGVRDREGAEAMIAAGANRIGASAGVKIVAGGEATAGGY